MPFLPFSLSFFRPAGVRWARRASDPLARRTWLRERGPAGNTEPHFSTLRSEPRSYCRIGYSSIIIWHEFLNSVSFFEEWDLSNCRILVFPRPWPRLYWFFLKHQGSYESTSAPCTPRRISENSSLEGKSWSDQATPTNAQYELANRVVFGKSTCSPINHPRKFDLFLRIP